MNLLHNSMANGETLYGLEEVASIYLFENTPYKACYLDTYNRTISVRTFSSMTDYLERKFLPGRIEITEFSEHPFKQSFFLASSEGFVYKYIKAMSSLVIKLFEEMSFNQEQIDLVTSRNTLYLLENPEFLETHLKEIKKERWI